MMTSTASPKLRALTYPPCDHDGTCSGMLSLSESRHAMTMLIVCDACGAHVRDLGEIAYELPPRLSGALQAA